MPNEQKKCVCGEEDIIGGAEVEIGGVCHRPNNPCYIIDTPTEEKSAFDKARVLADEMANAVSESILPPTVSKTIDIDEVIGMIEGMKYKGGGLKKFTYEKLAHNNALSSLKQKLEARKTQ